MTTQKNSTKVARMLFTFSYENGTSAYRVTNSNTDIVTHLGVFKSDSSIKVSLPPYVVNFADQTATIEMDARINNEFLGALTGPYVHSKVECFIREYEQDKTKTNFSLKHRFRGEVYRATINEGNVRHRVKLDVRSTIGEVQGKLGIPNTEECINPFGNPNTCKVDVAALSETGVVVSVNKQRIEISGITYNSSDPGYWNHGYVDYKGARSKILYREDDTDFFNLADYPSNIWIGQEVTVAPGCDHRRTTCAGRYGNILNSNFLAIDRLEYNPQFENIDQPS